MEKKLKQTKLMDWIKMEQTDFYSLFHKYLAAKFNFWNMKFDNGEYVWFCCLNESCQAGFILEYVNKFGLQADEVREKCLDILMLVPLAPTKHVFPDTSKMSPEERKEFHESFNH